MKTNHYLLLFMFGFCLNIYSQIPTDGLVGYWPFNGNSLDESGNDLNGTSDAPELVKDRFGICESAFSFSGDEILVADNDLLDFTSNFSLSIWYKSDSISTYLPQGLIGKLRNENGGRYFIQLHNPGDLYGPQPDFPKITFGINTGPTGATCEFHANNLLSDWHLIVGTYNGQSLKLYFDGELVDSVLTSLILPADTTPLYIGRESENVDAQVPDNSTVRYFYGNLDDIRIYNRALENKEIIALYNETKSNIVIYDTLWINDTITTEIFDTTFVTVYDSIAVTDTLIIDVSLTSMSPPDNINRIKVYPNPTNDLLYIYTGDNYFNITDYSIKIINSSGSTVFESNLSQQLFEIDVNDFGQTGLFFIQLIDDSSQIIDIKKILLE